MKYLQEDEQEKNLFGLNEKNELVNAILDVCVCVLFNVFWDPGRHIYEFTISLECLN